MRVVDVQCGADRQRQPGGDERIAAALAALAAEVQHVRKAVERIRVARRDQPGPRGRKVVRACARAVSAFSCHLVLILTSSSW
jgi:hypothetical protein